MPRGSGAPSCAPGRQPCCLRKPTWLCLVGTQPVKCGLSCTACFGGWMCGGLTVACAADTCRLAAPSLLLCDPHGHCRENDLDLVQFWPAGRLPLHLSPVNVRQIVSLWNTTRQTPSGVLARATQRMSVHSWCRSPLELLVRLPACSVTAFNDEARAPLCAPVPRPSACDVSRSLPGLSAPAI